MASAYDEVRLPRILLAGAGSMSGKTTITAGIIAALRRRGKAVRPFKVGPDFFDSAYLAHVAGAPCRNLDPWILGREAILQGFHRGCAEGDVAVIEGMLGLHDSWGAGMEGSTAELSKLIQAPVVLVLDVSSTVQSAAAIALGFKDVDRDVRIAGVILNRVDDAEHARWVEEAVWRLARIPVLGALPRMREIAIPQSDGYPAPVDDQAAFDAQSAALAAAIERHVDVDVLVRIADRANPVSGIPREPVLEPAGDVRLGVAFDEAFNLYYAGNLELLGEAGAEIVPFSPLTDHNLPRVDGVYLAGAQVEHHAARLAGNTRMLESIRDAHDSGVPIYAECGGLMYLSRMLLGVDQHEYPMAGLLPVQVEAGSNGRRAAYRQATMLHDCLLGPAGRSLRGHEYHWSRISDGSSNPAYQLTDPYEYKVGHEGFVRPGLLASNIHVHFGQDRELARSIVRAAAVRAASGALA